MKNYKEIIVFIALVMSSYMSAKITTPKVISDNMVLQRNEPVNIWGKSDANAEVSVKFGDITGNTKADGNGDWILKLPSMPADKNPKDIEISENGKLDKTIKNVLVGEVWVAGGQSNMGYPMSNTQEYSEEKENANYPNVRIFAQPGKDIGMLPNWDSPENSNWEYITPDNLGTKSAVQYHFAKNLSENLNIPVGILDAQVSGTPMIVWIPREDMKSCPELDQAATNYDERKAKYNYQEALKNWEKQVEAIKIKKRDAKKDNKKLKIRAPGKPLEIGPGGARSIPSNLYNSKVAPISKYTIRGAIWYQGEAEAIREDATGDMLYIFSNKFSTLIQSWRKCWNKPDMPFYFVQLPGFGDTTRDWAMTRWNQYLTTKKLKNVDMAVVSDLGEEKNIHPKIKAPVGKRLSDIALQKTYEKNIVSHGPMLDFIKYNGKNCTIKYDTFGKKLILKGEPQKFEILCEDKWIPASSVSVKEDGTITINSDKNIQGVRYLWTNWTVPYSCLFNDDGIPAMSFIDTKK